MSLRTGIDLIEIRRLDELNPKIRERFVQRVFTENERQECGENSARLAGRFAAKEAVAKALGSGIGAVTWQDIEVRQGPYGEPVLELHGAALQMAKDLRLNEWSISISHSQTHAVAVAVAVGAAVSPGAKPSGDEVDAEP
jgi:holo-[acyl-carrier protein] synthase